METEILKFEHPEYLYWLLVLPVLIAVYVLFRRWRRSQFKQFAQLQQRSYLMPNRSSQRQTIRFVLLCLVFIFAILGLANLQTGSKMEEVKRQGIDIYLCVDVSNSMNAEDIQPSRLARTKQAINNLISKFQGDRVGLVIFAGSAYIQLPITTDYNAAKLFVSTIKTSLIPNQGTHIGEAVELAVNSFAKDTRNKAIIIISDGEDHENGDAVKAVQDAVKQGIYVYTIGIGSDSGTPIPEIDKYGQKKGYKKDKDGNTVITKLDENILRQLANIGNGMYVRASNTNVGLDEVFKEINKIEKSEIETKVFTDYNDHFQWFIGVAIFFLILYIIVSSRKKQWETKFKFFEPNDEI